MSVALRKCASVDDFAELLDKLPRPMGVQANFGVIDANGGAAFFETHDHGFTRFDAGDTAEGVLIRTNFSVSGNDGKGMGYIRYAAAEHLAAEAISKGNITPRLLTEKLSRSFYHSLLSHDFENDTCRYVVDQDFIPRRSSVASVVIEGCEAGRPLSEATMWTVIGYPPAGHVVAATASYVPDELRPTLPGHTSRAAIENESLRKKIFPIEAGSGQRYIDMRALREINRQQRKLSLQAYERKNKR